MVICMKCSHRLTGSGTIRRCGLVEGIVLLLGMIGALRPGPVAHPLFLLPMDQAVDLCFEASSAPSACMLPRWQWTKPLNC